MIIGVGVLASSLLVGCTNAKEEVKEDVKVKEEVKQDHNKKEIVKKVEGETTNKETVSYKINKPSVFVKEWNAYAKKNKINTLNEFKSPIQEFDNGITFFLKKDSKEEIQMLQIKFNPSVAKDDLQKKAVEATAKGLFSTISKEDVTQWQDALKQTKKIDTASISEKEHISVPMLKMGKEYKVVFLYHGDDKKTEDNEEFIMIQVDKVKQP